MSVGGGPSVIFGHAAAGTTQKTRIFLLRGCEALPVHPSKDIRLCNRDATPPRAYAHRSIDIVHWDDAAMAKTATRKTKAAGRDAKSASGSAANNTVRAAAAATLVNKRRTHGVIAAAAGKSGRKPAVKMRKTRRTRDITGDSGARVPVNQII
ncbi:MAG TPA: hypothetical protein VGD75_04390, partial [Bradyrhizobium sp.]